MYTQYYLIIKRKKYTEESFIFDNWFQVWDYLFWRSWVKRKAQHSTSLTFMPQNVGTIFLNSSIMHSFVVLCK